VSDFLPTYLVINEEGLFESQIRQTEKEQLPRGQTTTDVLANTSLENYVSIMNQLLGPKPPDRPPSLNAPRYVSELPARLEASDMDYLESKGALCLPTAPFRKQLLRSYILWVHPQVPALDLPRFLRAIAANDGKDRISLLLFHAVMFAASAFVDISHIQDEGYVSRKAAREVLFRRVKVVFELNCEDDPLAAVQALLLIIYWNDLPHAEKGAPHWIGVCLSLAISIGLHRTPDSSSLTVSEQKMRKRTWWCVHNHTRLTVESLLSAIRMQEDRQDRKLFNVSMIALSDFEIMLFPPELRAVVDDCEVLRNVDYQKTYAQVFIEKARLCQLSRFSSILNRVQRLVRGEDKADSELYLGAKSTQVEVEDLQRWQSRLPDTVKTQCPASLAPTDCERSIYLHQTWLQLLYLGSLYGACCNDLEILDKDHAVFGQISRSLVAEKCLLDITDVLDEVDSLELSEQLPCPTSALLIFVLAYHRQPDIARTPENTRFSIRSLHKCWKVLRKLKESSDLAAHMTAAVEHAVCDDLWLSISDISLPWQKASVANRTPSTLW
ncbi:uncharacterized protein N7511_007753, partial [Penicillium nucicola]|uniref:uncharacterized protein n=1 Tax=Penicillium nucicola TaxID=1850975 RepID=UPI0025456FD0